MGLHLSALLLTLTHILRHQAYSTMERMANGWAIGGRLPREGFSPYREGRSLTYSPKSRKRLNWIRHACDQKS